jgi:Fe-S cluster assembly ATP-binding protein
MLEIKNLHASVEGKEILRGVNLTIRDGEVHVLMGPNGSGKSTLSNVLVGNPKYEVTEGSITFNGKDLLALPPEDRAHEGVFMSFQAPTEIPSVSMTNFMRAALNAKRKYFGQEPIPAGEFLKLLKEKRKLVGLDAHFMSRGVNEGFSGGERKRNEIFQMAVLEPTFSILDETRASTWTHCALWPRASTCCAPRRQVPWSLRTTSACSTTSSPTLCTCW